MGLPFSAAQDQDLGVCWGGLGAPQTPKHAHKPPNPAFFPLEAGEPKILLSLGGVSVKGADREGVAGG
jgi:hypothetical protein